MSHRERIRREHFAAGEIYGTVVYIAILVLLEEDRTDPVDAAAILVGTAIVFWLAHVPNARRCRVILEWDFRPPRSGLGRRRTQKR